MEQASSMGVLGFWAQSDAVGRSAVLLLLAMSVASWYLILTRTWQFWSARRQARRALDAFQGAGALEDALAKMLREAPQTPFTTAAVESAGTMTHVSCPPAGNDAWDPLGAAIRRAFGRARGRAAGRLESGLALLASVGATAPFVGLFGTVWGIYHALIGIGLTGRATIDKVAGPVGEALIMTALGIAVAVPAVLAYNALVRANRVLLAELDAFAYDLHVYLVTGAKPGARAAAPVMPLKACAGSAQGA